MNQTTKKLPWFERHPTLAMGLSVAAAVTAAGVAMFAIGRSSGRRQGRLEGIPAGTRLADRTELFFDDLHDTLGRGFESGLLYSASVDVVGSNGRSYTSTVTPTPEPVPVEISNLGDLSR